MKSRVKPTIRDVAAEAGVSIAAVSNVLNNRGRIGEKTRDRVLEASKKLGYFPNAAGSSLRSRKTDNIGLLFYPSCAKIFNNVFYSEVMTALEEELTRMNQSLLLAGYDISTQQNELPKFIRSGNVDGAIIMGGCPHDFVERIHEFHNLPLLLLDTDINSMGIDSITSDSFHSEIRAVQYLAKYGHTQLAFIRYDQDDFNQDAREKGVLEGARQAGLPAPRIIRVNYNHEAYVETRKMVHQGVTAILAVNDHMGAELVQQSRNNGLRVPDDFSLIGFDDSRYATSVSPELTTFRADKSTLGTLGVRTLLERIANPDLPARKQIMPTEMIERASVKKLD